MMNVKQKVQRIVLFLLIAATGYVVDDSVKAYSCKTFSSTTTSNTDLFGTPPQLQSIKQVVDGEKDTPVNSMNPGAMPDHSELLKLLKPSLPSSIDNSKDTALSDLFGTPPQLQSIKQVVDGEKDTPVNSMNPGAMPDHSELLKLLKPSLPSSIGNSKDTALSDLFGTPPQLQSIEQVADGEKDTPVNSMNPGAMPDYSEPLKLSKQSLPSSIDNSKDTALSKSSSSMLSIKEEQKYLKLDYIVPVIKAAFIKAAVIIAAKVAVIKAGEEEGKGKDGKTHSPSAPSEGKAQDEEIPLCVLLEVVIQFDQLDDKDKELLKKHSKDDLIIETNSKVEFK
ncbi:hypothetical protein FRACYDRAFT_247173 [Fragilariopsis cylindrus CCMP1102]|uniref:Uncharacterized protein n=1 Tax=Fragilariopsis cylindrus CCMP1102 TaxID=635003 RepID=A0A1E7EXE2_9STRA|nr:hypothetical protein FRACYDRAFT_247173 [Fragilariopsis cylindrus CCMP1102]|eukprot:OEU10631.1 hypothetical protein FRACYDRAFT_247173 [Fragilariopsis cylindrus CCMP1102]